MCPRPFASLIASLFSIPFDIEGDDIEQWEILLEP